MLEPNFTITEIETKEDYAKFVIEPLEQGYGHTLGTSLRRVLLTSLKGAAVSVIKIEGVRHQFSTLPGLKEDIVEFILNIKKLRLKIDTESEEELKLRVSKQGPGEITAEDIQVPAGVTITNPSLYLGTLADKKSKLEMEMIAKTGYGYEVARDKEVSTLGYMPIDSLYTPITRVNYKVEATRVGRMTDLDKLILELWTDGTIDPRHAIEQAARICVSYFVQLYKPKEKKVEEEKQVETVSDEILKMRIEELDIPTRIVNALENGGIETVEQLRAIEREDLVRIKNLGAKSLSIIANKLQEKGIDFLDNQRV